MDERKIQKLLDLLNELIEKPQVFGVEYNEDIDCAEMLQETLGYALMKTIEPNPRVTRAMGTPGRTAVSIWFDKDDFSKSEARNWLFDHGGKDRWRIPPADDSDGFWMFRQMPLAKQREYTGDIRSKYIDDGVLLKFVPARLL